MTDQRPGHPGKRNDPADTSASPESAEQASLVPPPRFSRRTVLAAGIPSAVAVLGLTALTSPRPAGLGAVMGDSQLTTALAPYLDGHRHVALAALDSSGAVRFGGFGADETTEFEIGSVSKTFTGALLAEAVTRGEVTVETTVAEVLGAQADGSAIADVTFAELATHTSGIPRLDPGTMARSWFAGFLRKDPYAGQDADQVIAAALATTPSGRGEDAYSNLAVALEGQLLAKAAGTDYASLLSARILDPLNLGGTYAPITADQLRETATRGHAGTGRRNAAWTMAGSAPAGGIRSTAADMATYLAGIFDGSAPGAAAATEVLFSPDDTRRTTMNWFHQDFAGDGTLIAFHNGMTGGFASFVGHNPRTGQGIVILTDTARNVDELGVGILTGKVAL